jgi:hypothetical protein
MTLWRLQVTASYPGWVRDSYVPCPITLSPTWHALPTSYYTTAVTEHLALEPNRYWNDGKRKGYQLNTELQQYSLLRNRRYFHRCFIWRIASDGKITGDWWTGRGLEGSGRGRIDELIRLWLEVQEKSRKPHSAHMNTSQLQVNTVTTTTN